MAHPQVFLQVQVARLHGRLPIMFRAPRVHSSMALYCRLRQHRVANTLIPRHSILHLPHPLPSSQPTASRPTASHLPHRLHRLGDLALESITTIEPTAAARKSAEWNVWHWKESMSIFKPGFQILLLDLPLLLFHHIDILGTFATPFSYVKMI
jgi:hypothetical protein